MAESKEYEKKYSLCGRYQGMWQLGKEIPVFFGQNLSGKWMEWVDKFSIADARSQKQDLQFDLSSFQ